jgi:hypothetical protein
MRALTVFVLLGVAVWNIFAEHPFVAIALAGGAMYLILTAR